MCEESSVSYTFHSKNGMMCSRLKVLMTSNHISYCLYLFSEHLCPAFYGQIKQ